MSQDFISIGHGKGENHTLRADHPDAPRIRAAGEKALEAFKKQMADSWYAEAIPGLDECLEIRRIGGSFYRGIVRPEEGQVRWGRRVAAATDTGFQYVDDGLGDSLIHPWIRREAQRLEWQKILDESMREKGVY